MERWQKVLIVVLSAVTVVFTTFSIGFSVGSRRNGPAQLTGPGADSIHSVQEAYNKILSEAVEPPSERSLVRERRTSSRPELLDLLSGTYRGARRSAAEAVERLTTLTVTLASDVVLLARR